ncbi:MAG: terminase large subunit [Eubacteriales bacterium]|nr:terminase large subunit [Eubacteriales bacterium]MDD4513403.1 terminase large subunit [Eubacteriales bacterium]
MRKLKKYKQTRFKATDSVYDKAAADYAVAFVEALAHTKGTWAGKPFELIDWQEQIIRDVFGTLKPNGYRQFNTAYVEIPKKMGKSELAAAVALLLTCGDNEERAEVYGCAADRNQASIVFNVAADIIDGRKNDPTFYPVIYGAAQEDDWTDPKVWKKANPSLGITVGMDKVKAAFESAKQNPAEENSFRQLRLNQWVKQAIRWMPMDKWDACAFPVDEKSLEGRVCYGGLDLSSSTDITAFVLVFPPLDEEDKYCVLPYFWIPEDNIHLRVRRDHVNYDVWKKQGFLQTTEGNVVHYGYIEQFIETLGEKYNIREIAFDRWGAVQMTQNLENLGFSVVPFGQGFKDMSPPTKELMKLTLEEKIAHGGHPVLRWMMDNIFIRTDPAGNIKADKEKSTEKIDGAVATIMALDRAIRCGNDTGESVYNTRGLLVF